MLTIAILHPVPYLAAKISGSARKHTMLIMISRMKWDKKEKYWKK
jgi:hypothetical protein